MEQLEDRRKASRRDETLDIYRETRDAASGAELRSVTNVKLSVAMAACNEERTIEAAMSQVLAVRGAFELELIVVDDGSSDTTLEIMRSFDDPRVTVLVHEQCRGKGAAILAAAAAASGTHILVFDADLEYSADDIPSLVEPVLNGSAGVVYGARIPGMRTVFPSWTYALGSKVTTICANLLFGSWLRDMHTCLKLMPLRLFRELALSESGFGLDTEMTGEVLRRGIRPYEIPCSYRGRSVSDGKKITPRDGLECLSVMLKVRFRGFIDYDAGMLEPIRVLPSDARASSGYAGSNADGEREMSKRPAAFAGVSSLRFGRLRQRPALAVGGGDSKAL
ncbi:MAG: glycosyl transferase family protein [Acidimicrobiaceae bacterium]|nr:glycosyl transferase family protein [Acidimicrobiaceae bacterium]